jgi:hypothetical protein
VAVTYIRTPKTVIGRGSTPTVNVTLENQLDSLEMINVTIYANASVVGALSNIVLPARGSLTVNFPWNTTDSAMGNYILTVVLDAIQNETDVADNVLSAEPVIVTILGDVNGDKYVNIKDAVLLNAAFGSQRGQPGYDPNADINGDGYINIKDAVIQGTHFGEYW